MEKPCKSEIIKEMKSKGMILFKDEINKGYIDRLEKYIYYLEDVAFGVDMASYCQLDIEGEIKCEKQCDHCKEYYKPLNK